MRRVRTVAKRRELIRPHRGRVRPAVEKDQRWPGRVPERQRGGRRRVVGDHARAHGLTRRVQRPVHVVLAPRVAQRRVDDSCQRGVVARHSGRRRRGQRSHAEQQPAHGCCSAAQPPRQYLEYITFHENVELGTFHENIELGTAAHAASAFWTFFWIGQQQQAGPGRSAWPCCCCRWPYCRRCHSCHPLLPLIHSAVAVRCCHRARQSARTAAAKILLAALSCRARRPPPRLGTAPGPTRRRRRHSTT